MKHLCIIFFVACALRGLVLLTPLAVDQPLVFDEGEFASIAQTLAREGVYEGTYNRYFRYKAHRPPLYPAFLAGIYLLTSEQHFVRSVKIAQVLLGALIPLLVYLYVNLLQDAGNPNPIAAR